MYNLRPGKTMNTFTGKMKIGLNGSGKMTKFIVQIYYRRQVIAKG